VTFRKYLILAAVAIFASCGDVCLARGMRDFGAVTTANWHRISLKPSASTEPKRYSHSGRRDTVTLEPV